LRKFSETWRAFASYRPDVFDTETMAELCVRQGLIEQAITIYQRMATTADDAHLRRRYHERIVELERRPDFEPLETPGIRIHAGKGEVQVEWRLPPDTVEPTLQLLLLHRTPQGIEPETRTIPVGAPHGRTTVNAADLHSVRAAAGRTVGDLFVPIIRLPAPPVF
jgi:hypothetical protein